LYKVFAVRILYITGASVPSNSVESVQVTETAANLVERGHRVELLVDRAPGQSYKEVIGGVKIVRAHMRSRGRLVPALATRRLAHFFRRRFDLIIDQYNALGGLGVVLSVLKNVPLMLEVSRPHLAEILSAVGREHLVVHGALRLWNRVQFARASLIVATCPELVPPEFAGKTRAIDWGINTERFSPEFRRAAMCEQIRHVHDLRGHPVVGFHGPLDRDHGAQHLLEIFDRVLQVEGDARFLVVGSGPMAGEVREQCRQRDLDRYVVFTEEPASHERPYWLAAVDVAVAPYQAPGGSLARFGLYWPLGPLCELMACGAAPVTTDYARPRALLADGRGTWVPPGSLRAMVEEVVGLLRDRDRREAIGAKAARFVAESLDAEKCVARMDDALREAAAARQPRFKLF